MDLLTQESFREKVRGVREEFGVSEFDARAWIGWWYDERCLWSEVRGSGFEGLQEWLSGFEVSELEGACGRVVEKCEEMVIEKQKCCVHKWELLEDDYYEYGACGRVAEKVCVVCDLFYNMSGDFVYG